MFFNWSVSWDNCRSCSSAVCCRATEKKSHRSPKITDRSPVSSVVVVHCVECSSVVLRMLLMLSLDQSQIMSCSRSLVEVRTYWSHRFPSAVDFQSPVVSALLDALDRTRVPVHGIVALNRSSNEKESNKPNINYKEEHLSVNERTNERNP